MADDAREPADEATNVLLIEGVELTKTDALDQLCHRLTGWGAVVSLEVLADKSLRCVFEEPRAAQRAYDSLPSLFTTVCCHYDQASVCIPASDAFLAVPESDRLFLISPPFSPPVDWKPIVEGPPVVNHDLVARLQALSTQSDGGDASAQHAPCAGDTTVLHPSTAPTMPAIVLHFAGDDPDAPVGVAGMSVAGVRTAFPPRL